MAPQKPTVESKGLLQTPDLYKYILETNVYPREPEPLKHLRARSATHPQAIMGTTPDAGQLISLLLKLSGAKRAIEVGVFTGYSLLLTALSIPDDGKIVAIDLDRNAYEVGKPFIEKAGVGHKIEFIESEAKVALDKLLEDHDNKGSFDFAFVDADKENYINYHEQVMKLLKVNGIVVYDNTLWLGSVANKSEDLVYPDFKGFKEGRVATINFNKSLAADSRIEISMVPLGDGITICRRLY
ncbi:probable caffeoyl-CoA O-methyltransferase At4g26220 [Rutidosis leptorrhynchoides]|uniref:probable caffeoyl-CoA O-methyltransferase At4g26220 n=1 Tax=Rutidosis leptorrhynchoides TaxID=125765 RepID=UPI003A9979D3